MTFTGKPNSNLPEITAPADAVDWSSVDWEQLVDQLKSDIGFLVDHSDLGSASKLINEIQHLVSPSFLELDSSVDLASGNLLRENPLPDFSQKPKLPAAPLESQTPPATQFSLVAANPIAAGDQCSLEHDKRISPPRLFHQVLSRVPDPILLVDDEGNPLFLNPAFRRLSIEFSNSRRIPRSQELLNTIFKAVPRTAEDRKALSILLSKDNPSGQTMVTIHGVQQHIRWFTIDLTAQKTGRVYLFGNDSDEVQSLRNVESIQAGSKHLIQSRKQLLDELEFLIQKDFDSDISSAVYIVDIDDFKIVNDSIGYLLGDKLLGMVAQRISDILDVPHTVGKLSGDEFCVVATGIHNLNKIPSIGQEINKAVNRAFTVNGQETHISVSIGISVIRPDNFSAESVIQQADLAMYQAKQMGGNCFCFYNEDVRQRIQDRFFIRNEIRKALTRNEFEMYYQPKLDLKTGKIGGAEALIRWFRNGKFFRSPAEFIAEAETCGLILSISKWVFENVAKDMAHWRDSGYPEICTSLNLSPCHFRIGNPVDELKSAFRKFDVDPRLVEIEVTENAFLENLDYVIEQLHLVRKSGFNISIDDFGVGCNSLAYLKRLPINALKLDRSFVSGVVDCEFDATLVESMINIAHSLNQTVVAEGVESKIVADRLDEMGCDYIQGYWYAKPMSRADFEKKYLTQIQNEKNIKNK